MKRCIVAHRGWSGRAPENTMAAFRLAAADKRIDSVELDVQLSKDGVPVVIHDFKLKRTTGVSGQVKDRTWEQLAELDCGSWFSKEFAGERIPSLEQVLIELKGRLKLNIELKTATGLYPGLEKAVVELVRAHGMVQDVVLTSFDHYAVQRARSADPGFRTGLILSGLPMLVSEQLRFAGADFLSMDYHYLTPVFVRELLDGGVGMMAWTVNDPEAIRRMLTMHPKLQLCTNFPERVFPLLESAEAY